MAAPSCLMNHCRLIGKKRKTRQHHQRRNRQMLDSGVHQLLAFPLPQSVGTRGAITDARKRGIPVTIIEAQS